MDWARAKTILIVVFLIVNMFLIYQYNSTVEGGVKNIDRSRIEAIKNTLKNNRITLVGEIPDKAVSLPVLQTKYRLFTKDEIISILFNKNENISLSTNEEVTKMESSSSEVSIYANGEIYYKNRNFKPVQNPDIKDSMIGAEKFLKKMGFDQREMKLLKNEAGTGYVKFLYTQLYKGAFIDKSYIEIYASGDNILQCRALWFDSFSPSKTRKEVITSPTALLKVIDLYKNSSEPIVINNISQGYYFNTKYVQQFNVKTIEAGTAVPVWKVDTSRGAIYINAYNGKIENN